MNKRIICLLLALVMSVAMLACGSKSASNPTIPAAEPATEADAEATTAATNASGEEIVPTETVAQNETELEETDDKTVEIITTDGNGETLPPDVEVFVGVVEGEGSSDIKEDPDTTPTVTQPTTTTPTTQPTQGDSQIGTDFDLYTLSYEQYNAMSGEDQKKIIEMFGSADDFVTWYKAVEAQYKAEHPDVEIGGDGSINAGDLAG